MIVDKIENARLYSGLGNRICAAFEYIRSTDFSDVPEGTYEIQGKHVYAMVQSYEPKGIDGRQFEAHKKYIDVQYIVQGCEKMGYALLGQQKATTEYNEDDDYTLYEGDASFVDFEEGMFAIFYPDDLHIPSLESKPSKVKKVVVKVLV